MELTDYEQQIFDKLSECDAHGNLLIRFDVIYKVDSEKQGQPFVVALKKYIDVWGNFEFVGDGFSRFKRILPFGYIITQQKKKVSYIERIEAMQRQQITDLKKQFHYFDAKHWREHKQLAEPSQYGNTKRL